MYWRNKELHTEDPLLRLRSPALSAVQRPPRPVHYLLVQLTRATEQCFNLGVPLMWEHGHEGPLGYALRGGDGRGYICGCVDQPLREVVHAAR